MRKAQSARTLPSRGAYDSKTPTPLSFRRKETFVNLSHNGTGRERVVRVPHPGERWHLGGKACRKPVDDLSIGRKGGVGNARRRERLGGALSIHARGRLPRHAASRGEMRRLSERRPLGTLSTSQTMARRRVGKLSRWASRGRVTSRRLGRCGRRGHPDLA